MTQKRQIEIINEIERRTNEWIINESFQNMTCEGSLLRFEMELGLFVYPFKKRKWMTNFEKFVTKKEFNSNELYHITKSIFLKYYYKK